MGIAVRDEWWRRIGSPDNGFRYVDAAGRPLPASERKRLEALVVPPGWEEVHLSPDPERKIQAWGRDGAGRKQYIYHRGFVERRARRKWGRVLRYGRSLPVLRSETNRHLARREPDRLKVLATVVRLMSRAYFRVGSERYAVRNRTYGICTLRKRHLSIEGRTLVFTYRGKRRKDIRRVVADTPLVEILEQLLELPGGRLFQYVDESGRPRPVTEKAVNRYLRDLLGKRYTSKDLRTFGGTVRAATILADLGPGASGSEAKRNVVLCCRLVAQELGNTPAICRSAYIHPVVLEEYERKGRVMELDPVRTPPGVEAVAPEGYYAEEAALVRFLERHG